ncbi:thiamine pyrophosphate-binding protein [Methanofollis formosanus]|uniref:Thiamine pyrophosphate-binding protein n=1 Tax=Methanofollis formosanus TaxID=299308 RepID=A0A8G1A0T9_9EURY|nr:thiamine pyrophosphate-dependent enzyme [Methanofollis formosanus]QYZ78324.1 thiamine pyrophosphate-binding protein [Methanofollis formosanus]
MDEKSTPAGEQTVAEVMVAELARWGIDLYFGVPGTSSLGIIDAVRKHPDARFIQVRHEENAAMAASAYHKLTGKVAACVTIAGPGATNLATGLYDAKEDRAAVLAISGQVAGQYVGPGGFQEIDQDAFFRPVTVFNNTVHEKTRALKLVDMAVRRAIVERGVAQLSVPNNIQKEVLDPTCCPREGPPPSVRIAPDDTQVREAARALNAATRPVIIAGWGARGATESLLAVAGRIRAPVLTTYRAKGLVPEDHPWHLGVLGSVGTPAAREWATGADLILTCGVGFSSQTRVPAETPLVQVDLDPVKLGKNRETIALWGDCAVVLPRLLQHLEEREENGAKERIAGQKAEWLAQTAAEADPTAVPIRPPYIMQVLSEILPEDAVISIDVGENGWWFGRNFRMRPHQKFVMSGYLATMGFALPAALAARLAYPNRPAVCITGDGGFTMAMAEFLTAVKYDLPVTVIVLNNHELGMILVEQRMEHYPNFGTELHNPDFVDYAQACGGQGFRVERPDDLAPAVAEALAAGVPAIVDVETDPKRF